MPIARFQMPDGRIARFEVPEGTTPEQAAGFAAGYFEQDPFAELEATPQQPPEESGLLASLESGYRTAVGSGLYGLGELTGLEGVSKYGEEILQGQPGYAPITSEEVGQAFDQGVLPGLGAGAQYVTEATGEVAGGLPAYIATALAGAKTGAALMPIPQFKPAAGLAGSVIAPAMTYFFGQNRLAQEEQIRKAEEEGVPPPQFNDLETFGYGLLQSGVERTGIAVLARRFPILNRLFGGNKADAEAAARELAEQGRAAAFGRGAAAGVVTEVPVELTQQVLERMASDQELTSDEALAEYVEVMKRTAAGIAPIGGVTGVASRSGAISRQEAQQRQAREQELAEMRAQATEAAQTDLAATQAREFAEEELPDFGVGFASTGLGPTVSREGIMSDIRVADEEWDVEPIRQRLQETANAVTQLTEQSRKAIDEVERNQLYDQLNMARTENILAQAATYREAEQRLRAAGKQNEANGAMRKYYSTLDKAKVAFDQVQNQEIRTELGATLEQVTAKPEGFEPTVTEPTITEPTITEPTTTPTIAPQAVSAQIGLSPRSNAAKAIDQLDINTPEGRAQAREIINAVRDAKNTSPATIERMAQSPLVQELDAEVEAPVDVDLEEQADLEEPSGLEVDVTEPTLQEYARMWAEAKAAKNEAGADVIRGQALRVYSPSDFDAEIQSAVMRLAAERDIDISKPAKSQIELDRDATWSQNQDDDLRANMRDENTLGVLEALKRNENPVIAAVAQRFDEIPYTTPAVTVDEDAVVAAAKRAGLSKDEEIAVGGVFNSKTNTVTMRNELAAGNPEYVAHELVHAQASGVIKANPENLTETQRAGVEQLKNLYEYVKEQAYIPGRGLQIRPELTEFDYALTSVDEFLSEGMGNKRFQDYLKTVEYKNTNAWSEFVAAIAKMLGLKPDTAFTELLSAYEQITTRPEAKAPPKTEPAKVKLKKVKGTEWQGVGMGTRAADWVVEGRENIAVRQLNNRWYAVDLADNNKRIARGETKNDLLEVLSEKLKTYVTPEPKQAPSTKKRKAPADVGTPETLTEAAMKRYAKAYQQARKTDKFPGEEAVRVRQVIEKAIKEVGGKKAEIAKVRGAIAKAERLETEALTRPERKKAEAKAKQEQKFREREEAAQVERQKEIAKGAEETEKLQERERQRRARGAGIEPTDLLQASIERQLNELRTMAEAKRRNEMRPLLKKIIARVRELNPEWRAGDSEAKIIDSVLRAPNPVAFMRSIRSQYDPMYQAYLQGSLGVDEEMGLTETDALVGGMRQEFEQQMARMEQVMTETDAFNDAEIDEIMAAMRVLKNPKSDPEAAVEAQEVIQKYDDIVRAELTREEGELMFMISGGKKAVRVRESSVRQALAEHSMWDGKTRAYIAWVDPKEFVYLNTETLAGAESILNSFKYGTEDGKIKTRKIIEEGWPRIPFVRVGKEILEGEPYGSYGKTYHRGEVNWRDHEGRHRAAALAAAGVKRMPVVIRIKDVPYLDPDQMPIFTDRATFFGDPAGPFASATLTNPNSLVLGMDVFDSVPLSNKKLAEINDMFGVVKTEPETETGPEVETALEAGEVLFKIDTEATRAAEERVAASGGRIFSGEQDRKGLLRNMKDFGFKEEDGQMVRKGASDYVKDSVTVTDWVATKFLSSDSAVVNGIRRRLREMSVSEHEFLGSMLNASTSQVWHAEALGAVTLEFGNLRYNEELHKYEGIQDVNNYKTLIGKLEEISKDRGIPMNVIESDAHRYVEAKRLLAIRNEQELIQRKIDALNKSGRISNKRKAQKLQKYVDRYIHMDDAQIRTALEAGKAIPEYNDVFKIWDGMRKNVIKVMVDSGLVDQYEAEVWLDNSDYVPFYRESQLEAKQGPKEYISGLTADPNLKRFKGTDADVNNVFDNMAKWIEFYVSASVRNNSARRMLQEMRRVGMARAVDPKAKLSPSERERRVGVWEKGEKNFYVVDQPIFLEAFKGMESAGIPVIGIAAKFTDLLRKTVVLNPIFSLAQLSQDSFGAMFTSGLPLQTAVKLPIRVVKEFINTLNGTSASHSELRRMGAVGVRDYNAAVVIREAESFLTNMQDAKAGPLRRLMRGLENFSMASDNAVRQAIYELSQENGATKAEAIEKAFEVINFRRKGSSPTIQLANRLVPFFNAYLQALSVQQKVLAGDGISPRNKKSWNELAQNMAAFTALSIFMALMLEDDEEYQRMEPYVRNRMWYLGNGFGLPIRTDLFLLPKIIAEEVTRMAYDSASADPGVLKKAIKEGLANGLFGPTAVPQILKPTIEVAIDHSFHTGRALTPAYAEGLQNEFQYNEYTSELSKLIGAGVDGSPILIEHWLRGTFGSAAGLMMWTSNLWGMGAGIRPPENFREIATSAPGMGRFMSREFGGGLRSMFYDAAKLSNEAKSTYTTLSTRDPEGVDAWLSEDDNLIRALSDETIREYQKEIGKIRREIRDVSLSTQLDNDFKQEYLRELRAYEQIMLEAMDVKGIRETLNM